MNKKRYVINKRIMTKKRNLEKVLGKKLYKNLKITLTCLSMLAYLGGIKVFDNMFPVNGRPIDYSGCKLNIDNADMYDMDEMSSYSFKSRNFYPIDHDIHVSYEYINVKGYSFKVNYIYKDYDFLSTLRNYALNCLSSLDWLSDKVIEILNNNNIEFNFMESKDCLINPDKYHNGNDWIYAGWVFSTVNNVNIPYIEGHDEYQRLCVLHETGHVFDNLMYSFVNGGIYRDFLSLNSEEFGKDLELELNEVYNNMAGIKFSNYDIDVLEELHNEYFAEAFKVYFAGNSEDSSYQFAKQELEAYAPYTYSYLDTLLDDDKYIELQLGIKPNYGGVYKLTLK